MENKVMYGSLSDSFFREITLKHPHAIVIKEDQRTKLEYSFGVDVLKFKSELRDFFSKCHVLNIKCGISTDYRHENILHAQDAGADFAEIDFSLYNKEKNDYDLALEIAKERGFEIVKKNI
jgi:pyridoxine 5'-phosphate synthase PdxJ